jgi:hypothetical protein
MADPLLDGQQQNSIPSILQTLIFQENLLLKLNAVDTVLNALDDKVAATISAKKLKGYLHRNYLDDISFMRNLKRYSKLTENTELAMEYFGQDFLSHPETAFDEEFEATLATLNKRLNRIIGLLLKEYQKGEDIEF